MDKAFAKNFLQLCLDQNHPQMLAKSYQDYHVKGFNSIILTSAENLTIRLYICLPGETALNPNNDNILVHNHSFDFQTQVLIGYLENAVYETSKVTTQEGVWHKYIYESALNNTTGEMKLKFIEETPLELVKLQHVEAGASYCLHHHELHRIFVPNDRLVAMLFWQHRKIEQTPLIFSKVAQPEVFPTTGLYNRFASKKEIRDLVHLVIENL
ncbi:MAG: hypothetical protein AAFX01_01390 [Cyanobacteria bacterium J06638_28]